MSTARNPPRSHSRSRSKDAATTQTQQQQQHPSLPPHPTTPLRPSSRSSLRQSQRTYNNNTSPSPYLSSSSATRHHHYANSYGHPSASYSGGANVPAINALEPQFAELSDSMADLEANFMHLQLLHESLARFNECFSSLLYGLEVRAFCVDFGEAPIKESYANLKRGKYQSPSSFSSFNNNNEYSTYYSSEGGGAGGHGASSSGNDAYSANNETTFMTTDTSFVENPAPSTISSSKRAFMGEPTPVTPGPVSRSRGGAVGRGASASARGGRGAAARGGSGVIAGAGTGVGRGGVSRASGLPRGTSGIGVGGRGGVGGGVIGRGRR